MDSPGVIKITRDDTRYPQRLVRYLQEQAPTVLYALGNPDILKEDLLGLFCSIRCPGDVIIKTYDLVRELRDQGVTVASGFHSPMEKECLKFLVKGSQPIVICPARSILNMRVPREWENYLSDKRLLIISPFDKQYSRVTSKLAEKRNEFTAALSNPYSHPLRGKRGKVGSVTEKSRSMGQRQNRNVDIITIFIRVFFLLNIDN